MQRPAPGGTTMLMGLKGREAHTDVRANDPDLRGRTYAIPFGAVWDAAVSLADGDLKGWKIVSVDERAGLIVVHVDGRILPCSSRVEISIGLDDNAQTRVDTSARGRTAGVDLGGHAHRIRRLLRFLDRALAAEPHQILEGSAVCNDNIT